MPKSIPSPSPHDDPARVSDVALRKKKNADAQAAFRARRANYIATLEETVTSLESVVLELQESSREARAETQDSRMQMSRMRLEFRERENYWRALWQSKKSCQSCGDMPPLPPPNSAALLQSNNMNIHLAQPQLQYPDENLNYRNDDPCSGPFTGSEHPYSPSIPLTEPDPTQERLSKFQPFNYSVHASPRDTRWALQLPASTGVVPGADAPHQPQSPVYLESPSLTASEMSYSGRPFGAPEEQKVALHSVLDTAPYSFPNEERFGQRVADSVPCSRSLSPSPNTPSTSSALAPSYPFPYPDTQAQNNDRRDFDFRRHSLPHGGEVTLHGGTADISSLSGLANSDPVRFRLGSRKPDCGPEQQQPHPQQQRTPPIPTVPSSSALGGPNENGSSSHHDRANSETDAISLTSRSRRRRGTVPSSRSPSPNPPSLSCTVAVIKAQAFGALRRTRVRGKKSSEGAAKVAMGVLEARGIGIGVPTGSKRPRIDNESLAMET